MGHGNGVIGMSFSIK